MRKYHQIFVLAALLSGLICATAIGAAIQANPTFRFPKVRVQKLHTWLFRPPQAERTQLLSNLHRISAWVPGGSVAAGPFLVEWAFEPGHLEEVCARREALMRIGDRALYIEQNFPVAVAAYQSILSDGVEIQRGVGEEVEARAAYRLTRSSAATEDYSGAQVALQEVRKRTHWSCGVGRDEWDTNLTARTTAFQVAKDAGDRFESRLQELIRTNRAAAPEARMLLVERFLREKRYSEARELLAKLPHDPDSYSVEEKMAAVYLKRLPAQASAISTPSLP